MTETCINCKYERSTEVPDWLLDAMKEGSPEAILSTINQEGYVWGLFEDGQFKHGRHLGDPDYKPESGGIIEVHVTGFNQPYTYIGMKVISVKIVKKINNGN